MTYPPPEWSSDPNQFPSQQPPFSTPAGGFSTNPQYPGSVPPGQSGSPPPGWGQPGSPPPGWGQPGYGQPGYGQPGYGQQGPFGQPGGYGQPGFGQLGPPQQPGPNRNGLIIGGVIGAVLIVALGIGGAVFFLSGDEADPPATLPTASAPVQPTSDPTGGPTAEPSPEPPAPEPGDGPYVFVADFCDQLDYQPVFDVLPHEDGPEADQYEFGSSQETQCRYDMTDGSSFGNSSVSATVFPDAESAQQSFESSVEVEDSFNEEREDADGWWDVGYLYYDTSIDSAVGLLIKAENLVVNLHFFIAGDAADRDAQAAAATAVSENIRDVLSA